MASTARSQNLAQMMAKLERFSEPGLGYYWHRNVTGVRLNPHQLQYYDCFEQNPRIVVKGSRRVRKSYPVASWFLKEAVTKPFSEVNIFAPALEQSKRNLQYMADMVLRSPLLMNFLDKRQGGVALGRERIRFRNGSVIQTKGQASSVDGLGSTHIWLEELDDMDMEVINTRIMPTGAMLKDNYDYGRIGQCQTVASGTIKGMFNLFALEFPDSDTPDSQRWTMAPVFDCWYGVAAGIISEDFIEAARSMMTKEQFARTYLALYTEASNFFPTRYLARMLATHIDGNEFSIRRAEATGRYAPWGNVIFGLDMAGQGQQEGKSSNYGLVILDQITPDLYALLHAEEFDPLTRPDVLRERLLELFRFYRPVRGIADSYDANLAFAIGKDAYDAGLHRMNPAKWKHGEGKEGWESWWCIPVNQSGPRKHQEYMYAQRRVYERGLIHPPIRNIDPALDDLSHPMQKLIDQMEGIISTPTQGQSGYDKYEPANKILGDDLVDALIMAMETRKFIVRSYPAFGGAAGTTGQGFREPTFSTPSFHSQPFRSEADVLEMLGEVWEHGPGGLWLPEGFARLGLGRAA